MIYLKMLYYFILLIIDSIILQVLVFLNPQYGANSPDEIYRILGIMDEANELLPKIKDHTNLYKTMSYNDYMEKYDEVNAQLMKYNLRYYELLVQLHTNMFSIILNG